MSVSWLLSALLQWMSLNIIILFTTHKCSPFLFHELIILFYEFWHFSCPITSFGNIVKDLAHFTTISFRLFSIHVHIEVLEIFRFSVEWMRTATLAHMWTILWEIYKKQHEFKECHSNECLSHLACKITHRVLYSDRHSHLCGSRSSTSEWQLVNWMQVRPECNRGGHAVDAMEVFIACNFYFCLRKCDANDTALATVRLTGNQISQSQSSVNHIYFSSYLIWRILVVALMPAIPLYICITQLEFAGVIFSITYVMPKLTTKNRKLNNRNSIANTLWETEM